MATCEYCGSQIPDGAKFCTECGAARAVTQEKYQQPSYSQPAQQPYGQQPYQPYGQQPGQQPYGQAQPVYSTPTQPVNDSGSIGWGILGFLFPIVGLILFLIWKDTKPKSAKIAGIGALVSVALSIIFYVFGAMGTVVGTRL